MSRWSISKKYHYIFLRHCTIILCYSDKYSGGGNKIHFLGFFSDLAPRLVMNSSFQNYTHPDDHTRQTINFILYIFFSRWDWLCLVLCKSLSQRWHLSQRSINGGWELWLQVLQRLVLWIPLGMYRYNTVWTFSSSPTLRDWFWLCVTARDSS